MSNDVRDEHLTEARETEARETDAGPLRHFRLGRRVMLQSLASGVGVAAFAARASAQHDHHAALAAAVSTAPATANSADSTLAFFDRHAFDTLATLSEQIVPGARAAGVPEFLDRLVAVESTDTQKYVMQAIGAFEYEARGAHGKPWKSLTEPEATALLTKISTLPDGDPMRRLFEAVKGAISQTYYESEIGMKELGWNGGIAFAPPTACESVPATR